MTDLLDRAVKTVRALAPEVQDEIARLMLAYSGDEEQPAELTLEELADLEASDAEVARGEFATDEQMRVLWAKHGK